MCTLLDWSYELLPANQRRAFEDLSVFADGCTLESALRVRIGDITERTTVLEILSSLVDKSLAVADLDANEGRYTLLKTTREYARDKLVERGDADAVLHRHAEAYLSLAQCLSDEWNTSPNRAWYEQSRRELENWRACLHWTIPERHDVLLGQRLICALQPVWSSFALSEGRKWCRHALDLVEDSTPNTVVAGLKYTESLLAFLAGDLNLALPSAEQALDEFQTLDDPRGIAKAETIVGRVLCEAGRGAEGEAVLRDALEIAIRINEPVLAATAHYGIGLSRSAADDLDGARRHVDEACAIAKKHSADRVAAVAATVSAEVHFRAGNKGVTIQLAEDALRLARDVGDEFSIMRALSNLATYLVVYDRYDEARNVSDEALEFSHLARGATMVLWILQHVAVVEATRGNLAKAARLYGFTGAHLSNVSAFGDYSDQLERARLRAMLANALSREELETLTASGAAMSESQAIAEAQSA